MNVISAALLLLPMAATALAEKRSVERSEPPPPAPRYWDANAWDPTAGEEFWRAGADRRASETHPAGKSVENPEAAKSTE